MGEKFLQLKLLKMDGEFFHSSEVKAFYFDSDATGRIGILPDHTNFYAVAAPGTIEIHLQNEKKSFFADKGYILIKNNVCTMVSDGFRNCNQK